MKRTSNSLIKLAPLLALGAHPDDIEFGCGGVIARETRAGRKAHFVVCSRGEAGSYGTPKERVAEAKRAAARLGATDYLVKPMKVDDFHRILRHVCPEIEANP